MVDDADDHLLILDHLANRLEVAGAGRTRLEGQRVGVDLIERLERGLVALHVGKDALLGRIAPAGVAPHLGLVAQALYGVVENLHQVARVELAEGLAAGRHHVDLRLLQLDDGTAGIGQLIELLVERVADRPRALDRVLVIVVLDGSRDQLGQDRAELDRLLGHALRRLPHRRVLQGAAPYRPDDPREHARLKKIVQNMPARIGDGADLVGGGLWRFGKAVHVGERIALPAHAADLLVVVRVAVGEDVETRDFLRPQKARDRVLVLLAVARIDHRFEEALASQHRCVPGRPRQRADDRGWQSNTRRCFVHRFLSCARARLTDRRLRSSGPRFSRARGRAPAAARRNRGSG
jgi:hypothetical protein